MLPLLLLLGGQVDSTRDGFIEVCFLRFWRAFQELHRRLRQGSEDDEEPEPLAEELVEFLHGLLRGLDDEDRINSGWLASEIRTSQEASADAAAWKPLAEAIGITSKFPDQSWTAHEVSTVLLGWLPSLAEDYCRGPRSASIRAVCDVARCNRRNACLCLGRCGWDIELAMQAACEDHASTASADVSSESRIRSTPFGGALAWLTQSRLDGVAGPAWSSRGAKLRKAEVECPICTVPYHEDANRVDTRCCFQVLCVACRTRLTDETGLFTCPFCRVSGIPHQDGTPSPCAWSAPRQLRVPFRGAGADLVRSLSNGFEQVATSFLDIDRPRRPDIMTNIYRPGGSAEPRAQSSEPVRPRGA